MSKRAGRPDIFHVDMIKKYVIRICIDYDPAAALWCGLCCHVYHCHVNAGLYEDDVRIAGVCPDCYDAMKADFDEFRSRLKRRAKRMRKAGLRRNAERVERIYDCMSSLPAIEDGVLMGDGFLR